jgi:hypothetical protein
MPPDSNATGILSNVLKKLAIINGNEYLKKYENRFSNVTIALLNT